ncbi:MAG: aldehyde dehydrogenase family protein [Acidimicrobiia bacterium]
MSTITSHNPRTGEQVGSVPVTGHSEVADAVARARKAFREWHALDIEERLAHIRGLKGTLRRNADRIVEVVVCETGKHPSDAMLADVAPALAVADYYIRRAVRILSPRRASSRPLFTKRAWVEYHPLGVAGVISPWNYPFLLPFNPTVMALTAGCTVVLKPSEVTPLSGALVQELANEAGLPSGTVQVVHGTADTAGALIDAADVVSFTGSSQTARKVAAQAAKTLTPVILELGGKDAMVVLEDADLRRAARAATWGGLTNAGQTCIAVERLYVVDEAYDRFVTMLAEQVGKLTVGSNDARDIGPITTPQQMEIIERHITDAVDKGARILVGGKRSDQTGSFFEPTILVDVDHTMDIMREETFGPVLPVMKVPTAEAALELANDSAYGLHGSVWTRDRSRGRSLASAMETGTVAVNDCLVNYGIPDLPFGGIKDSGYGSSNGPEGLRAFTYPKAITDSRIRPKRELWWFPRRGGRRLWRWVLRLVGGR